MKPTILRSFLQFLYRKFELEHFSPHKTKLMPNLDWCNESYFDYLSKEDIEKDYLNLIKDLDSKSILTVALVINRIREFKDKKNEYFFLTEEENRELYKIKAELLGGTVKINNNIWSYQNYLLPFGYFEPSIFYYRYFLNEFTKIHRDKSIIDAGGFVGDSALILSEYTNDKVYTFEPMNKQYELLQKTLKLNNITNIITENFGLSDKDGSANIYSANDGSSSIRDKKANTTTCEVKFKTLDGYVEEHNLKIGLIKTDVEGAEQLLLAGALKTIIEQKPNLLISIYHGANDFFHIKPLIESWNLGYKFKIRKPATEYTSGEIILIAEVF
jgi:FkbM family methyltransferase